mgnify:CR=1 FL=1
MRAPSDHSSRRPVGWARPSAASGDWLCGDGPLIRSAEARRLDALADAVAAHHDYLKTSGVLEKHREEDARHQVLSIARQILLERIRQSTSEDALAGLVHRVASRELDPHSAAEELAAGVLH